MKQIFVILAFMILFVVSCSPTVVVSGDITDPRIEPIGDPFSRVYLQSTLKSNTSDPIDVVWTSSIQGVIGKEQNLDNHLIPGDHKISLNANSSLIDTTSVFIYDYVFTPGKTLYRPQYYKQENQVLPPGEYSYFSVSIPLEGESQFTSNLELTTPTTNRYSLVSRSSLRSMGQEADSELEEFKDFVHHEVVYKSENLFQVNGEDSPIRAGAIAPKLPAKVLNQNNTLPTRYSESKSTTKSYNIGDEKSYYLWTGSSGYERITTKLYSVGKYIQVWVDVEGYSSTFDDDAINEVIRLAEENVLPRQVHDIVGPHYDLDNSGNFSIVMSKKINEGRFAIGFFNPGDFFDSSQPGSNEEDIIYLGFPDYGDHNFTPRSLAATIGHEYTHLVYFSNKTYIPLIEGKTSTIKLEETFLNEGLAHLTESLFGFGESGGNFLFLKSYFIWPEKFSLSDKNTVGRSDDSQERRGAVLALLWWLFEQEGGAVWNSDGSITDKGGISFISRLIKSPYIGWDNVVKSSKKYRSVTEILSTWASEYLQYNSGEESPEKNIIHPQTQEIVTTTPFIQEFTYNNAPRRLDTIYTVGVSDTINPYPYTIVWGDSFVMSETSKLTIPTEDRGNMTYGFPMLRTTP